MYEFGSDYNKSDDENEIEIHFVDLSSDEDSNLDSDQEIGLENG